MKLKILGDIHFQDIRRSVPLGILEDVSKEFLFFVKETRDVARRTVAFASIYDNPDYSEHSMLTPVDAVCYPNHSLPCVLIFIRTETCTETVALHELMHAYLYFAEGYDNPRALHGHLPFHVKLLAKDIGNIAMDLHTNRRLKLRGFPIDALREEYFGALRDYIPLMTQPHYADEVAIQWQIAAIWAHMLAGSAFYGLTDDNLCVHRRLDGVCRKHSPGTIRFRDLMVGAYQGIGYDTPDKVARIIDELTPKLFQALGERFQPEYLRKSGRRSGKHQERELCFGDTLISKGAQA